MPKGKPWPVAQDRQLIELRRNGKTVAEIAELMNKSPDAIKQKLRRLGLKVVTIQNNEGTTTTSSELIIPEDLPSIEEALLKLAAAMKALENPKLTKTDVMRLRTLIQTSTIYQKRLAEYVGYKKIERKLVATDEKLEQYVKSRKNEKRCD
ncbi:MAG: sigma factor-like helix-turn-helix DNA-binding protein [Candidatus Bathyarchaeota archaeon]